MSKSLVIVEYTFHLMFVKTQNSQKGNLGGEPWCPK